MTWPHKRASSTLESILAHALAAPQSVTHSPAGGVQDLEAAGHGSPGQCQTLAIPFTVIAPCVPPTSSMTLTR